MVRTQIQLQEDQYRDLKRWSQRLGISLSEAVRRCVAERIGCEPVAPTYDERVKRVLALAGKYRDRDGEKDVSRRHDDYLVEAYGTNPRK
jgi:hypothetical protein